MKTQELRKKDIKELQKSVQELQKKLSEARFRSSANQLKNVKEINGIKKEIARSLTIINETAK
ncbi:MAG: 50S ribosomal protein L29 [Candidatus Staskawiczbacteria bacterium]|nr:50S ribosomal protein L29 [Candidatus Staskawiczbacteria bacterium]